MPIKKTTNKMDPKSSDARAMPLAGEEAVELYAAEIASKIAALGKQADLLRAEVGESRQLLRDIARAGGDDGRADG